MDLKMSESARDVSHVLSPVPPVDMHAPSERWWKTDGVERLYAGDIVRVRGFEKTIAGKGSHGQDVLGKVQKAGTVRTINAMSEYVTYGRVTSVVPNGDVVTVHYSVMETSSVSRGGFVGTIAQGTVHWHNRKPPHQRSREYRRLAGSGPSQQVREAMSPFEHSGIFRILSFRRLVDRIGPNADRALMRGAWRPVPAPGRPHDPITAETIRAWRDGTMEIPGGAFRVLNDLIDPEDRLEVDREVLKLSVDELRAAMRPAPVAKPAGIGSLSAKRVVEEPLENYEPLPIVAPRPVVERVDEDLPEGYEEPEDIVPFRGSDDAVSFSVKDDCTDFLPAVEEYDDDYYRDAAE